MEVILVIAEFNKNENAVSEKRINTVDSYDRACNWLNNETRPAMFFIDGMQNHDRFLDLCCSYNPEYWKEYKKVID